MLFLSISAHAASVQISALNPKSKTVGSAAFTLQVTGKGFKAGRTVVRWNGSARPTNVTNSTNLTASVTANDVSVAGNASVTVFDSTNGQVSNALQFTITSSSPTPTPVVISTSSLPGGTVGSSYGAGLVGSGGITPYKWSLSSGTLPAGLSLNASTGVVSGTPTASGSSAFAVRLTDSSSTPQSTTSNFSIAVAAANQAPSVSVTATPVTGTAPLQVQFKATAADADGSIAGYNWTFGDGQGSSSASPSYTYQTSGNFTAKVVVTDNSGATASASVGISVTSTSGGSDGACTKTISPGSGVLQAALNALKPGETLCLRGGVYSTGGTFGTSADTTLLSTSGSASAPMTVRAYAGETPIIHGQFKIQGSYLNIKGMIFEGPLSRDDTSATERRANLIEFSGSHDVTLENLEVRKSDYHSGIYLANVSNIKILRCYFHDNGRFSIESDPVTGDKTYNVDHGIYWGSTSGAGNVVAESVFVGNRGYGLQLYPNTRDVTVVDNTFVGNGNSGIIVAGSASDRITIVNNVSANNGRNKQIRVLAGSNNLVRNNITWSTSSTLQGVDNSTSSPVSETKIVDPKFVSSTDWHLQSGSPAIDVGLPSYTLDADREYTARPQGTGPDLGAFERKP